MLRSTTISDQFVDAVLRSVGARAPESGGAIMGLRGRNVLTHFLFDEHADTSGASYIPSRSLEAAVRDLEQQRAGAIEFKGILHSHPSGMNRPSATDVASLSDYLEENPHLETMTAIICTFASGAASESLDEHELSVRSLRFSFFTVRPDSERPGRLRPLPIGEAGLVTAMNDHGFGQATEYAAVLVEGAPMLQCSFVDDHGRRRVVLVADTYPATPPVLLDGDGRSATSGRWNLNSPPNERASEWVRSTCAVDDGRTTAPDTIPVRTEPADDVGADAPDDAPGRRRGIAGRVVGTLFRVATAPLVRGLPRFASRSESADLFARSTGLLDDAIASESAFVLGCGSVGSSVATLLARAGMGSFTLVDPDAVESHNIGRSEYDVGQIGRSKPQALRTVLRRVNPGIVVTCLPTDLNAIDWSDLAGLIEQSSVVIGACDSPTAQARLAHFAYRLGKPGVFVGIHEKARGGEIIASVPPGPCFNCGVRTREEIGDDERRLDYSTGRLVAEPGLYTDIHAVSSFAAKLALSLTPSLPADSSLRTAFRGPLEHDKTWVAIGLTPQFWFFPQLLGDVPGQHAFQSVWLNIERTPECTTCGSSPSGLQTHGDDDIGALREQLAVPDGHEESD